MGSAAAILVLLSALQDDGPMQKARKVLAKVEKDIKALDGVKDVRIAGSEQAPKILIELKSAAASTRVSDLLEGSVDGIRFLFEPGGDRMELTTDAAKADQEARAKAPAMLKKFAGVVDAVLAEGAKPEITVTVADKEAQERIGTLVADTIRGAVVKFAVKESKK